MSDEHVPVVEETTPVDETEADGMGDIDLPEAMPPIVSAHHVSLWYRDVIGVNDVSFHLVPGITGLLGPNGAGKSSLIKMLVGLVRPAAGTVQVLGEDPWNNPALMGRLGYVPEAPAPWREDTGRDAAVRAARLAGLVEGGAGQRVDHVLEKVGLTHAADRPVETYSHGMQQRLKFALALLNDPDLLILDEPLLGADPLARRDLIRLMQELAAEGKSILLSTHVLPDVEALTDRIVVVDHGRLLAHGTVAEIRDLLEQYPRTVRITSPDPRAIGAALWDWESVSSIQVEHGALVVRTTDPSDFFPRLQRLLAESDLPFSSIRVPDDSVEAVFRYLVS